MESSRFRSAVSPVVAVILMVAITVILSAVIGTFVLDLGQKTTSEAGQSDIGLTTSQSNGNVTATVVTGSADELKLLVNGTEVSNISNASPGDLITATAPAGSQVTFVVVNDGDATVVSSTTVSSSTVSTASAAVPTTDLTVHYTMDSADMTSSVAVDAVTPLYNGSRHDADAGVPGVSNEAVSVGGNSTNGNDVRNTSYARNGSFTVSFWMKSDVSDQGNYTGVFASDYNGKSGNSWQLSWWDGKLTLTAEFGSSGGRISVPADKWMLVTVTHNRTTSETTLYENGSQVKNWTGDIELTSIVIGANRNYDSFYAGDIDEFRLYERELNQTEIQNIYESGK